MSVFQALGEEHRLMRALGRRLERTLEDPDERFARREVRSLLLLLLRALESHEAFENAVFARPLRGASADRRDAARVLAREHAQVDRLRGEATALLREGSDGSLPALRALTQKLAAALDAHFDLEERDLWPRLNAVESRSARAHAGRAAATRVKEMRRDLDGYWAAVNEYLASDS